MSNSLFGKPAPRSDQDGRRLSQTPFPVFAVFLIAIFLLLLFGLAGLRAAPAYLACSEVTESFTDSAVVESFAGAPGDTVWMSIDLKNDSLLMGFWFLVSFDPSLLHPIPSTGDPTYIQAQPVGRIVEVDSSFDGGGWTYDTTSNFYVSQSFNPFDSGALVIGFNATYVDSATPPIASGGSGTVARIAFVVDSNAAIGQSAICDFRAVNEFVVNPQNPADTFFADCRRSNLAVMWNDVDVAATIYPTTAAGAFTVQEAVLQPPTIVCYDSAISITTCGPDSVCLVLDVTGADTVWADGGMWENGQFCAWVDESGPHDYTVYARNEVGTDSCTIAIDATVQSTPTACFVADPNRGGVPLSVNFTNCSATDGNMTYRWDFGDGNTSTEFEPTHVYSNVGYYDVTLIAANECGADTLTVDSAVGAQLGSPQWIVISCAAPLLNGEPLQPGDIVTAYDPDGIMCGVDTIGADGLFGFMPIYADDIRTIADEGADPGDTIAIFINGVQVTTSPTVIWTTFGDEYSVCEFSSERCLTLDLSPGWHLISWNVEYSAATSDWLAQNAGCIDVVVGFNQGGLVYDPLLPGFSTLNSVDYLHGYWVNVTCPFTMEICGPPIEPSQSIPIYSGWNLVGYWPESSATPDDAFASIVQNINFAYGFDGQIQVYDPSMPQFSTLSQMAPGFGYWVQSTAMDTLVYPGFIPPSSSSPANMAIQPFRTAPSRQFVAAYGDNLTVDGRSIRDGADIAFRSSDDLLAGIGQYQDGRLRMTPIYGTEGMQASGTGLPGKNDSVQVFVDGKRVYPDIVWTAAGDRIRLGKFTTGSDVIIPEAYILDQNYPNPFNPTTTIAFTLAAPGDVQLAVYNIVGQQVSLLVDRHMEAGRHEVVWDGHSDAGFALPSGVYFYRLTANDYTRTMRMTLLK